MTNEQAVEARWPAVLELLGRRRKVTALLRDARVAAVQADDITLEFDYAFPAEQVEKPENRLVTEKALQRVFGRPLRVRAVVKGATEHSTVAARIKEPEEQHDTLDWADMEAWIKSNPRTEGNRYGGYYTSCPVPTHKTNDRIGVWKDNDGIHLKCYGGCTELDIRKEIKKPRIEALEQEWNSPEAQLAEEQTAEYWEAQATAAKAERDRENAARIAAETERDQARAARADAEERIQNLRGGKLQARQEERDKAESQISGLRQDLKNAQAQHKRSQEKLRADNETLQKQLAAATPEVMNDAWRHIRNGEPLAAYREAMAILESKLRDVLGNPRKPTSSQELDLYPLMEMAATKGHINGKQLDHLDLMRERRNSFAHNSEEKVRKSKNPLTESEARATVAYLGQVIDQPEA